MICLFDPTDTILCDKSNKCSSCPMCDDILLTLTTKKVLVKWFKVLNALDKQAEQAKIIKELHKNMVRVKVKVDGINRMVYVRDQNCVKYKCFVPSCANDEKYYCRVNEVQGCPETITIKAKNEL